MSCPFYGCSLFFGHGVIPVIDQQAGSNRCALITDAHSPCWMEVGEEREPEWKECPRNPVFIQVAVENEPEYSRFAAHSIYIIGLAMARGKVTR